MSLRCFDSICNALKRSGIECDLVDIEAETDESLSCSENLKNIMYGIGISKKSNKEERYEAMYKQEYGKSAKIKCKDPVKVKAHKRSCPTRR